MAYQLKIRIRKAEELIICQMNRVKVSEENQELMHQKLYLKLAPRNNHVSKMLCLLSPIQMWEALLACSSIRGKVCTGLLNAGKPGA